MLAQTDEQSSDYMLPPLESINMESTNIREYNITILMYVRLFIAI